MLKQKFLVQFGSNILLKIIGLISGVIVARIAGPEVVGILAYATSFVSLFLFLTGLFGTAHIKLISEGRNLGNCVQTYTVLQLCGITIFIIAVIVYFSIKKYFLDTFESVTIEQVVLIIFAATVMVKLVDFNNSTFTAQLKQAKANYPILLQGLILQIGRIAIVLLGFRALGLAFWQLLASLIILPFAIRLYKTNPIGKFDKLLAKEYFKILLPISLIVLINSVVTWSDKLFLHHYTDSVELGYYSAAYSLGGIILMIGGSIGTVFFPLFSSLISRNDWTTVNTKINSFETFITIFIFPGVCLLAILSEPIISLLLGDKYSLSSIPFAILLFASYLNIVGMPYGNIINGMGRFNIVLWLNLVKMIVYIAAIVVLISPDYMGLGATGLAVNLLIVNLVNNSLFFIVSRRIGKVKINSSNVFRYIIILFTSLLVYILFLRIKDMSNYGWLIIIPVYFLLVYGMLLITKQISRSQLSNLKQLINIKNTYNYVKDEIKE